MMNLNDLDASEQRAMAAESAASYPSAEYLAGLRNVNCESYRIEQAVIAERERCCRIVDQYLSSTGRSCAAAALLEKLRSDK